MNLLGDGEVKGHSKKRVGNVRVWKKSEVGRLLPANVCVSKSARLTVVTMHAQLKQNTIAMNKNIAKDKKILIDTIGFYLYYSNRKYVISCIHRSIVPTEAPVRNRLPQCAVVVRDCLALSIIAPWRRNRRLMFIFPYSCFMYIYISCFTLVENNSIYCVLLHRAHHGVINGRCSRTSSIRQSWLFIFSKIQSINSSFLLKFFYCPATNSTDIVFL